MIIAASRLKNAAGKSAWELVRRTRLSSYLKSDRRPWRTGYGEYRQQFLEEAINNSALLRALAKSEPLPQGYGFRLDARVIEIPWVLTRVGQIQGNFLDAGSALNYDFVLQSPLLANKRRTIVTLAPEGDAFWRLGVSYVYGDLRSLDFRDNLFDAIACVSTIEHIGMDNSMYAGKSDLAKRGNPKEFLEAVAELRRVLKPGGSLYITFPFGRYENHGWFQQFDSELVDILIEGFGPELVHEDIFRYDPDGWRRSDRTSCASCEFFDVHESKYYDASSTIEYPPDFPAGERALVCLELQKQR
jgi:SAM-dependent methyltransferase